MARPRGKGGSRGKGAARAGGKGAIRGRAPREATFADITNSLHYIESWCRAIRYILSRMDPDKAIPITEMQSEWIVRDGVKRQQNYCPPPLTVDKECPPPSEEY